MGINDVGDEQQMGGPACHSSGGDVAREALLSKTDQQHYRTANLSVRHSTIPDFKKFGEVPGTRRTRAAAVDVTLQRAWLRPWVGCLLRLHRQLAVPTVDGF